MKRTLLTFAFMMSVVFGLFANEITPSFAAAISDKSFSVSLANWKADEVEISIVDQFGTVVISETVTPAVSKSRVYNMKYMVDGAYTVIVEDATKASKQDVVLNEGAVAVGAVSKTVYKPSFRVNNNVVKINYLSLGKATTVRLVDAEGHVLYNEKFANESVINRALNVSKLERGFYYATVTTPEESYTFDVIK